MGIFDFFRKKPSSTELAADAAESENEHATFHCFVLCPAAEPGDLSSAPAAVAQVFGRKFSAEVDQEKRIITVTRGKEIVGFLMHMPIPIPGGEAEECADRNFLWPKGKEAAATHRSHVIVTLANIGGAAKAPIQSAIAVTRLALVAFKVFAGIGIYWGNASVSNSREVFEDFCQDMSEEHVPVPMWLRFQPVRAEDGKLGLYTLGMKQFGLMDLEVDRCQREPHDLFEFVSNIAHYLIQSGPVIADGNTVGGSAEERILVRHRPSMIDKDKKVYKIVFEG